MRYQEPNGGHRDALGSGILGALNERQRTGVATLQASAQKLLTDLQALGLALRTPRRAQGAAMKGVAA